MARIARIVLPRLPHHVTHRGNRQAPIFITEEDRESYLRRLMHYSAECGVGVWSYCLMTNHVHLLAVPENGEALALAVGRTHMMHARALNQREGWSGHLWANRFYSAPVEPASAERVARYIELNPVRAGLCRTPEEYPWSSASSHCRGTHDPVLAADDPFATNPAGWRRWLEAGVSDCSVEQVRRATATGTPIGSSEFLEELERRLGRRLTRRRYRRKNEDR